MILVDTSVWVDHFRVGRQGTGGTAGCRNGSGTPVRDRRAFARELASAPDHPGNPSRTCHNRSSQRIAEVLHFIERHALFGCGVGYLDVHLLAAVRLTAGAVLWTRGPAAPWHRRTIGLGDIRLPIPKIIVTSATPILAVKSFGKPNPPPPQCGPIVVVPRPAPALSTAAGGRMAGMPGPTGGGSPFSLRSLEPAAP